MQETHSHRDVVFVFADRLKSLERFHRRHRLVGWAVALLAGAFVTVGAAGLVPDTIAARSFRLVDAGGVERAVLTAGDRGTVVLTLLEGSGDRAVTMTLAPTAPFVVVVDAKGNTVTPSAAATPPQPVKEPKKGGLFDWGKRVPADDAEDDSFDWAD